MKKLLAILLALVMVLSLAACAGNEEPVDEAPVDEAPVEETPVDEAPVEEAPVDETPVEEAPEVTVMTHEEYMAAEIDSEVVVEFYVQGAQGWWYDDEAGHGKITVYGQDEVGGYFGYELNCTEEDAAKLVPGTKIRVTGYKTEWAGEIEIMDGVCEIIEGDTYVAETLDVTELLGTEDLVKHQNMFVSFTGLTVESISYKNDAPGDDIYVTVSYNGASYDFCVEMYLTGPDTEVYQTVGTLEAGDVINVEGFLYWYEGVNTHITAVSVAE